MYVSSTAASHLVIIFTGGSVTYLVGIKPALRPHGLTQKQETRGAAMQGLALGGLAAGTWKSKQPTGPVLGSLYLKGMA